MHYDGYGDDHKGAGRSITAPGLHNNEYHYFGLEWSPTFIKYYYDGKVGNTLTDPKVMVKVDEYILLTGMHWAETGWVQVDVRNNALLNNGGTARAYIDHIRVFKNKTINTSIPDLTQKNDIADVFADNKEIIVQFNEQSANFARIDIYNANGMLIKQYNKIDLNSEQREVRLKSDTHIASTMYFVKVSVDGESICKKVIL